jgi:hypothetical protein
MMAETDVSNETPRRVQVSFRRMNDLRSGLQERQASLEGGAPLVATDDEVRQYELLLGDLRSEGLEIAPWHEPEPDASGAVSGVQLLDSLDVLIKLEEDATDTRLPSGSS